MPRGGHQHSDRQRYIVLIVIGVLTISVSWVFSQSTTPNEIATSKNDDIRDLSVSLTGGGVFGTVSNSTCYSEKFVFNNGSSMGLYGSFVVGGSSLVHFFVTDEQGWTEFCTQKATDRKVRDIPDTTGEESWSVEIPYAGLWYVVYSRAWYTDLQKDIRGTTCRDLTGPQIDVELPFGISLSGVVELNITISETTFLIDRIDVFLDNQLLRPSYEQDMGSFFNDIIPWNTTSHAEGSHILTIRAYDSVGNSQSYIRVVKIYNYVDLTIPVLGVTCVLTILILFALYYSREISLMPMMIGLVVLAAAIAVSLYLILNTVYDINEIFGLVTGVAGVVGLPSAIAVAIEKKTK